jgi:hypothetical protein
MSLEGEDMKSVKSKRGRGMWKKKTKRGKKEKLKFKVKN